MSLIKQNVNLSQYVSFKASGSAKYFAEPQNMDELIKCLQFAKDEKIEYFILGKGSNVLVKESGISKLCIRLTKFDGLEIDGEYITAKAGTTTAKVASEARRNSLAGFEEIGGIPGTIGGAVFMNAGAHGKEMCEVLISSSYLDTSGNIITITNEQHDFSYRHSFYKENPQYIILEAKIKLKKDAEANILARTHELKNERITKQPLEYPSAGSTFKRPGNGMFVGQILEEMGLKGYSVGGAKISKKHAGFVINRNNATATDIINLIEYIKKEVLEKKSVSLECEVMIIGD